MIPNPNFNPSFSNLTALRGLGGLPHPVGPGAVPMPGSIGPPRFAQDPAPGGFNPAPAPVFQGGGGMPGQMPMPGAGGLPGQFPMPGAMPGPMPFDPRMGGTNNLMALQQLFGRTGGFRG